MGSGNCGGIVNNLAWCESATDSEEDKAATSRWDGAFNRWFMDPVFKGSYPADMVEWYQSKDVMPEIKAGDMEKIASAKGDILGANYYTRRLVASDPANAHIAARQVYCPCVKRAGFDEFEVYPEGLYHILKWVKNNYTDIPVYITENGTTLEGEVVGADGCVHDTERVEEFCRPNLGHKDKTRVAAPACELPLASILLPPAFCRCVGRFAPEFSPMQRKLGQKTRCSGADRQNKAIKESCPVKGCFVWSFMDNWEWGFGFTKRFGIVYTDYEGELRRIPKDSAHFLK